MRDPRENITHDPRQELKEKMKGCGYPFEFTELEGMAVVKFELPKGNLSISIKQAARRPMVDIKALIEAAMNQDEIKKSLPIPSAEREADME